MIKRFQTPEELSILFKLPDDIEKQLLCDRSAWIQWLVENITNPKIGVLASVEEGQANGYVVAIDNVMPPISDSVSLLYIWYSWIPLKRKKTNALIEAVRAWGEDVSAKRIVTVMSEDQLIHVKVTNFKIIGQLASLEI